MAIQTFIDDSKKDGRVLVLAGYLGAAQTWAKLSDEWRDALLGPPPWRRFKMTEIMYRSLDPDLVRTKKHYEIIRSHALAAICVAVPIDVYNKVADEMGYVNQDRNPYFLAWNLLISMVIGFAKSKGLNQPIDFYFDDQTEKKQIYLGWDQFYETIPRNAKKFIRGVPNYRNDEDLMPLQAADFLAWWKRREYIEYGTVCRAGPLVPWDHDIGAHEQYLYGEVDEPRIRKIVLNQLDMKRYGFKSHFSLGASYGRGFSWKS